jgi:hypothetical protein
MQADYHTIKKESEVVTTSNFFLKKGRTSDETEASVGSKD